MEKKAFLKVFDIKFSGLQTGKHYFDFQVDSRLFLAYEESLLKESDVNLKLCIDKQTEVLFLLEFIFSGTIKCICDRCVDTFDYAISNLYTMIMKIDGSEEKESDDDEIIYVSPHESRINIADLVYEYMLMQLPLKTTCDMANKKCDPEMIKKLKKILAKEKEINIDPRWEGLKKLGNN